ncbi:MAG: NADH:ubiquinone oxidoreductase 21kD subunit [Pycnora praestabilis]|nr:MAG: NADH:ubiquinone oxidoreductase 21kD subunit [Pycnora praestabilis]
MSLIRTSLRWRNLSLTKPTAAQISQTHVRHNSKVADRSIQPEPKSDSSDSPAASPGDSSMIRQEGAEGAITSTRNQPDYGAPVDHGTSRFSLVPKRILDGSEPGDVLSAAVLSGAPVELEARTVRIYRPAKTATQSGDWHGHHWRMDWDILHKGYRWENPLMGWQSSADFMQGTHLNFTSKEDAIRFAQKQGYEYFVQEPNERRVIPKAYANNFIHSPKKLKVIRTK